MSSKYSISPPKSKEVRLGKTTQVSGGGCRLSRWVRDRGYRNPRANDSSLDNVDREGTIVLGETYLE